MDIRKGDVWVGDDGMEREILGVAKRDFRWRRPGARGCSWILRAGFVAWVQRANARLVRRDGEEVE